MAANAAEGLPGFTLTKDFNYRPFKEKVMPQMFHQFADYAPFKFFVKLKPGDPTTAIASIQKTWATLVPQLWLQREEAVSVAGQFASVDMVALRHFSVPAPDCERVTVRNQRRRIDRIVERIRRPP